MRKAVRLVRYGRRRSGWEVNVPLLAGIDVGTTNTKVGIYDENGTAHAVDRRPTDRDANRLVDGVRVALRGCIDAVGRAPDAVGVTSMAETGVAVDADLAPLHQPLRWDDPRGAVEVAWLEREIGAGELWSRSGINLGVKTPLARWVWLRRHHPDLLESMRFWFNAADLIAAGLGGGAMTDATLAARTGAFDAVGGVWSADILRQVGLTPDVLPQVGQVGRSGAVAGLRTGTPIVVAGHDHLVAAFAAGTRSVGHSADSMGTAEAVVTLTATPPPARYCGSGISWNRAVVGDGYCLLSGFPGSGRLVDWFSRKFASDIAEFERLSGSVERVPTEMIVEPYIVGRSAPEPDADVMIRISRMVERHGIADLALAVLEGSCFHVRWIAEQQAQAAGSAVDRLQVFGGPTRNAVWMRTKAAVMPAGIKVVHDADLAVVGAALIAGLRCDLLDEVPILPAAAQSAPARLSAAYSDLYLNEFLPRVRSAKVSGDVQHP